MAHAIVRTRAIALGFFLVATITHSQDEGEQNLFSPENAVVDTSILFVLGAREEQQSLRSSFGWPTFQEGQIEGTYFRFDPDGYARFSPSPRLDTNVFEVLCEPGTLTCSASKGFFQFGLTQDSIVQISLGGFQTDDQVFISDGETEFVLPITPLGNLDQDLEDIFGNGGDLIVKRGETEVERTSLTSFYPTATYLKWLAAEQSSEVFSASWPSPAKTNTIENVVTQSLQAKAPVNEPVPTVEQSLNLHNESLSQLEAVEPANLTVSGEQEISRLTFLIEQNGFLLSSLENRLDALENAVQSSISMHNPNLPNTADAVSASPQTVDSSHGQDLQTDIVAELLRQLNGEPKTNTGNNEALDEDRKRISQNDYMVLSEYLRFRLATLE